MIAIQQYKFDKKYRDIIGFTHMNENKLPA